MKNFMVVVLLLGFTTAMGQFRYRSLLVNQALRAENRGLAKVVTRFRQEAALLTPMGATAYLERDSRSFKEALPQPTIPFGLCNNFKLWEITKTRKCNAKLTYLTEMAQLAHTFANFETNYRMNNGIKLQLFEKYARIINMINHEFDQMEREHVARQRFSWLRP